MVASSNVKQLIKILIGAAWIDGKVQIEEREYLHRVAQQAEVANDPEIQPLLNELRVVSIDECYKWIEEYLGDCPSQEDYQQMIEALSALIYSDGDVDTEEAKLLTRLQLLNPANESPKSASNKVLKTIQNIYRRWIDKQV
ncbi:MAG: TerB family tellurite resistance protein [Symploca sp. SIO2G7]|nr:TerB family tellurite resistance protein [Symploca sp. SIO2G7]